MKPPPSSRPAGKPKAPWFRSAQPARGPEGGPPGPRWRFYARRIGVLSLLMVVLGGLSAAALAGYARFEFDKVHKEVLRHLAPSPSPGSGPVTSENILIVGNNTRIGQHEGYFGSVAEDGGSRSDVTMVLHLDPATGSASLLSIPRDLFVPLPKGSMSGSHGKIDASLNDGPDNLVNAITSDLGIPIDHYIELDFDGFQNVINAIGGIPMDFPMLVRDSESGLDITQTGCQLLNGSQALAVVRARHLRYFANGKWVSDPNSDLSRIRRDQLFLRALVGTIKSKGLNNPLKAAGVLDSLVKDITIDSGFSESEMVSLGARYHTIDPGTVPGLTLPITLVPGYGGYGDVDFPSQPQDQQVVDQFLGVAAAPRVAGQRVGVENVSGDASQGSTVEQALTAAGYAVTSLPSGPAVRAPSESVIEYAPGDLAAAKGLLGDLGGAVTMAPDASLSAGTLQLQVGSVLAVAPPASPPAPAPDASPTSTVSVTPSPSAAAGSAAAGSAAAGGPAPAPTSTPAVPTPGGQPSSPAVFPTQPWDPIACPAGASPGQ